MSLTREHLSTNLYLLDDLDDASKAHSLGQGDLDALRAVAGWITAFVAKPHKDLGRAGTVCPFVPGALDRNTLWLAPERVEERNVAEIVDLIEGYQRLFTETQPTEGDDATYKAFVVVFTDLPEPRASDFFADVLEPLAVPSYANDGFVMGGFHEGNDVTAIYNSGFRPFTPPVPFLLMRHGVVSDWKFFLDDRDWLNRWASRYGESGAKALADELRRLPWRARRDSSASGETGATHE